MLNLEFKVKLLLPHTQDPLGQGIQGSLGIQGRLGIQGSLGIQEFRDSSYFRDSR